MTNIWAKTALTDQGWEHGVSVAYDADGIIQSVRSGEERAGTEVDILLPSPGNLHSHSFQRAMAGLTERRGDDPQDSFWTWRKLMYAFVDNLTPDDVASIAAFQQMETLEAGYASSAEFHYIHHQSGGVPYENVAELSEAIMHGADQSGIGLTLLPVLYQYGGCDRRELKDGQLRFGNDLDRYSKLFEAASAALKSLPGDACMGVAPHSLRAVDKAGLSRCAELASGSVKHIHIAEQIAEVEEVISALGARPVEWLLSNAEVDQSWCLVHATQMTPQETEAVAASGAVVGLCPITESNLGDGIFDGVRYQDAGGVWGVGSDSNVRISLSEELRTLEYSQRLQNKSRIVYGDQARSCGRVLYDESLKGGALATHRQSGAIKAGHLADFMALDDTSIHLLGQDGDGILDGFIFAGDDHMITDVWSAGRHVVAGGRHKNHDDITDRYRRTMTALRSRI